MRLAQRERQSRTRSKTKNASGDTMRITNRKRIANTAGLSLHTSSPSRPLPRPEDENGACCGLQLCASLAERGKASRFLSRQSWPTDGDKALLSTTGRGPPGFRAVIQMQKTLFMNARWRGGGKPLQPIINCKDRI